MTAATREPEDDELDAVRWNDRALFGSFRGLPWWAAVLITFVLAIVGTYIDVTTSTEKTVGWVFAITFFVGAVGAVVFVERRSMFGPVVQPPLVLAIVVPLIVVFTAGLPSGGLAAIGLGLGKPLIDGFPAMAITTLCTVLIGILRVSTQKDPNRLTKDEKRELKRKDAEDRPKKRRDPAATGSTPDDDRPRRKPAASAPSDEPRSKRPRPSGEGGRPAADRPAADRPRRPRDPAKGDRPAQRKPRPRTDG